MTHTDQGQGQRHHHQVHQPRDWEQTSRHRWLFAYFILFLFWLWQRHLPLLLPGSLTCHCRPLRFKTIEKYLADLIVRCQYLINPIDCKLCCFCSYTVFDLSETGWWEPPAIAEQILVIITSEMRGQKRPSSFSKSLTDAELLEIIDMRSCLPGQDTLLSSDVSSHSSRPPELSCKLITLNKPTEETEVCQALLESGVNGKYIVVLSVILLVCLCPYCN